MAKRRIQNANMFAKQKGSNADILIEQLNKKITKKVKEAGKLRENITKLRKTKSSLTNKKLTLMIKQLTKRNKEIKSLVTDINKYSKVKKISPAGKKITRAAKTYFFKKGIKDQRKKRETIKRFITTVIGIDGRSTAKQKVKMLTQLMKPNTEIDFIAETGNGQLLQQVVLRKIGPCHVGDTTNIKFVKTYIPALREQLYTLASQYFNGRDKLNTTKEKIEYRRKFLDAFDFAGKDPCLEGTFTALTNVLVNTGFNWGGRRADPLNVGNAAAIKNFTNKVVGPAMKSFYNTFDEKETENFNNMNNDDKVNRFWQKFKNQTVHKRGQGGMPVYQNMGKLPNNLGKKMTKQAFENYGQWL